MNELISLTDYETKFWLKVAEKALQRVRVKIEKVKNEKAKGKLRVEERELLDRITALGGGNNRDRIGK